ncbi:MAG TPA: phosphoglucosamine mutase [Terriglobales bacterium]|nr:phosphoglucosamine mutase [Terriglobales bacterium]
MSRKLFGTDGIRGVAGEFPLDRPTVFAIGRALGHHLSQKTRSPRVVLGQDTRESSGWIADVLIAGLATWNIESSSAGVITTPGVAYLARELGYAAGVVISASHNPWNDNGIKVFGGDGYKLPDETELSIEQEIFRLLQDAATPQSQVVVESSLPGRADLRERYEKWLKTRIESPRIEGKVVIDCANGAASNIAPELFAMLGLDADFIHHHPNGRNINDHCGALHPQIVAQEVKRRNGVLGVTFDGDADRALFADRHGNVVNGDAVLLMAARDLQGRQQLDSATLVATTMSNMGLEAALKSSSIRMLRAPVGDKYVLEEMRKTGAVLGGEQSGHIIFSRLATTGDGLLTALIVLDILSRNGKQLDALVGDLKVFPQVIKNVRVREKIALDQLAVVSAAIKEAESELAGSGRVVVRYSGTEPLARVMIEAESESQMERHAEAIAAAIRREIGA